ncbi:hypothetical protein J4E86_001016 [Alternaria arbusti]|uniref:uncharacterized protein n=1 Tax=Alternaria arbusti TaxID=232088 RepID=UPI00221E598E|nr:uncharacterized protein J4E86_001016 [Alternaria arbusti]KAI4961986.1 hypothetical protein J4E86_001016 [Alternaria arbusti]
MTSTFFTPFSLASLPNDHHPRVLEAHIVIHVLILSTAILLIMQLISHTAAAEAVEDYGVPPEWKKQLMRLTLAKTRTRHRTSAIKSKLYTSQWHIITLDQRLGQPTIVISGILGSTHIPPLSPPGLQAPSS